MPPSHHCCWLHQYQLDRKVRKVRNTNTNTITRANYPSNHQKLVFLNSVNGRTRNMHDKAKLHICLQCI